LGLFARIVFILTTRRLSAPLILKEHLNLSERSVVNITSIPASDFTT